MAFDTSRLFSTLLVSKLQQDNPALYQVIYQLISALKDVQSVVNSGSGTAGDTTITNIEQFFQIGGSDGDGGGEGLIVPGPVGPSGATGATGPSGGILATIFEDSEDEARYPPIAGPQGNAGTTGAQGALGNTMYPNDGEDGETGYILLQERTASSPSGLVFLGSQTGSASATLDFTSLISATYNEYIFEFENILPATDNVDLLMRTSTDNGSTYAASAGDYRYADFVNNTGSFSTDDVCSASDSAIKIAPTMDSGSSTGGFCGTLKLYNPLNATQNKSVTFSGSAFLNDNQYYNIQGSGWRIATADIDAVRFLMSSGNIASGTIRMYGVKNS